MMEIAPGIKTGEMEGEEAREGGIAQERNVLEVCVNNTLLQCDTVLSGGTLCTVCVCVSTRPHCDRQ